MIHFRVSNLRQSLLTLNYALGQVRDDTRFVLLLGRSIVCQLYFNTYTCLATPPTNLGLYTAITVLRHYFTNSESSHTEGGFIMDKILRRRWEPT